MMHKIKWLFKSHLSQSFDDCLASGEVSKEQEITYQEHYSSKWLLTDVLLYPPHSYDEYVKLL